MPQPEMNVLAEGSLPTGHHWILRGSGTRSDFRTFLETTHPDGQRDSGGMGGPALYPGSVMNTYTGTTSQGMRRILVRADPQVARAGLQLGSGERLDLFPAATWPEVGLVFFAALLPPTAVLVSITAVHENGQALETQNLTRHEEQHQRFRRRLEDPGAS